MEKLSVKKLIENRFILFMPFVSVYTGILLFFLDTQVIGTKPVVEVCLSFLFPIVLCQGSTTFLYYKGEKNDKSILLLSWVVSVIGVCLNVLVCIMKGAI